MAVHDMQVDRIDEGAIDPLGNPFITWYMRDARASEKLDNALDVHDVKRVFVRSLDSRDGGWTVRFTAYDRDGTCITEKVCSTYEGG